MSNRSILNLLAMTAMMSDMGSIYSDNNRSNPLNIKDISVKRPTPPTPKGMKWFDIDGVQVQAVTKKSAIKKAKKLSTTNQTKALH